MKKLSVNQHRFLSGEPQPAPRTLSLTWLHHPPPLSLSLCSHVHIWQEKKKGNKDPMLLAHVRNPTYHGDMVSCLSCGSWFIHFSWLDLLHSYFVYLYSIIILVIVSKIFSVSYESFWLDYETIGQGCTISFSNWTSEIRN